MNVLHLYSSPKRICSGFGYLLQVVAGELELKECNMNWSPVDFESKLQVRTSLSDGKYT